MKNAITITTGSRISATDVKLKPEEILPPDLQPMILRLIQDKKAECDAEIVALEGQVKKAEAAHLQAVNARSAATPTNARGVGVLASESAPQRRVARIAAVELANLREVLRMTRTKRRDLDTLERKAQRGLRVVLTELANRYSSQILYGRALLEQSKPAEVAARLAGLGEPTFQATGPIDRLQRRLRWRQAAREEGK